MKRVLLQILVAVGLVAMGYGAEEPKFSPDAAVTLSTDRNEYLLGENVLLNYVLENKGKEPFTVEFGGDYRGCDRSLRFKVAATDEKGTKALDPDPNPMCFGGLGGSRTVVPGEKLFFSIPLTRYCQIDHPGTYTITAWHDLGWKDLSHVAPSGETKLHFRMPTPEEAETIVQRMEKLSEEQSNMVTGNKVPVRDFSDFRCLRYQVYLQPLLRRATAGNALALEGLGCIPTPEATSALIDLADGSDPKLSLDAAHILSNRLPDPEFQGDLKSRGSFNLYATAKKKALSEQSWDTKFTARVRSLAIKFLSRPDEGGVSAGAFLFQIVGTPADASDVFRALDHALDGCMTPRRDSKGDVLDFPTNVTELLRATQMLYARGYSDHGTPSGDAQLLAYFQNQISEKPQRPDNFAEMIVNFGMGQNRYPTRQVSLLAIPQPMPDDYVKIVQTGLADRDYGVIRVACDVAGKSGRKEFLKPILEIIQTENEPWLMRSAMQNALLLGGGVDALNACADRLGDEELTDISLNSLQSVITALPNGSSGRTDLTREERLSMRDAWRAFLKEHETELKQGKKFPIGDPAIKAELFNRARSFQFPNGVTWPAS